MKIRRVENTRTKTVVSNILYSFSLKGISILTSLVVVPITLNYLNDYEYGLWLTISSVLIWIGYFDIGIGNGLRNKMCEAFAEGDVDLANKYFSTSLVMVTMIILPLLLVFLLLSGTHIINWYSFFNANQSRVKDLYFIMNAIFIIYCLLFVVKLITNVYQGLQKSFVSDLINTIGGLLSLGIIYALTYCSEGNLKLVALAFSLPTLIITLCLYPVLFKKYPGLKPKISNVDIKIGKNILNLGIMFFLLQIVCLVLYSTSNIVISKLFSPAEVTPYNIIYRYYNVAHMVLQILLVPVWSAITDAKSRKDYVWINVAMKRMIFIWVAIVLAVGVMYLLAPWVIKIWVGDSVNISIELSVCMAIYVISLGWNTVFATFFNGMGIIKPQIMLSLISAITFIPIAIVLSKCLGLAGVALALTICMLSTTIVLPILFMKYKRNSLA